jgi:hypothetical protein
MLIKFEGFKVPPYRDHIVVMAEGKYRKFAVGEVADVKPEDGYRLLATGEFAEVQPEAPKSKTTSAQSAPNRAILDGKAE